MWYKDTHVGKTHTYENSLKSCKINKILGLHAFIVPLCIRPSWKKHLKWQWLTMSFNISGTVLFSSMSSGSSTAYPLRTNSSPISSFWKWKMNVFLSGRANLQLKWGEMVSKYPKVEVISGKVPGTEIMDDVVSSVWPHPLRTLAWQQDLLHS